MGRGPGLSVKSGDSYFLLPRVNRWIATEIKYPVLDKYYNVLSSLTLSIKFLKPSSYPELHKHRFLCSTNIGGL